jgi:hypothetical protein
VTRLVVLLASAVLALWLAGCAELPASAAGLSPRNLGGVIRITCPTPCTTWRPSVGAPLTLPEE